MQCRAFLYNAMLRFVMQCKASLYNAELCFVILCDVCNAVVRSALESIAMYAVQWAILEQSLE
jgi:hypothetical protein